MAKTYDFLFKLILEGDNGVGKTCIMCRFAEGTFNSTFMSTIGKRQGGFKNRTLPEIINGTAVIT